MRTEVDERLLREAAQYRLRFACEHCAHFDDAPAPREARPPHSSAPHAPAGETGGECSQGYPSAEHRGVTLEVGMTRVFCKMFEVS